MNMKLLLIEDNLQDVEEIREEVERFGVCTDGRGRNWQFTLEHLPGEGEREDYGDATYQDYDKNVFGKIQQEVDEQTADNRVGILLDVILNAAERQASSYEKVRLASEIYKEFSQKVPIYIVTSISHFYPNSQRIMGVNVSDRFIHKDIWTKLRMKSEIEKLQNFYMNWGEDTH